MLRSISGLITFLLVNLTFQLFSILAHRLNNVPLALYFATHFYFSTYHVFSNMMLRKVITTYKSGFARKCLYIAVVLTFAYFTGKMIRIEIYRVTASYLFNKDLHVHSFFSFHGNINNQCVSGLFLRRQKYGLHGWICLLRDLLHR